MPQPAPFDLLVLSAGAFGFGLIMLIRGGGWLIEAVVYLARRLGVSKLLVGSTIVAFGTSAPELVVSVGANLQGLPGIAVGNVVGSNTANVLFILAMTAIITPVAGSTQAIRRDVVLMVISALALLGLGFAGTIDRGVGTLMVLALAAHVTWQYRTEVLAGRDRVHTHLEEVEVKEVEFRGVGPAVGYVLAGLAGLVLGAELLVRGAVTGATILGVPEAIIGLTIVAVGTSLPELFAGIAAASRNHGDIVLGNIVGSNVFNILSILGLAALIQPLAIDPAFAARDIPVMMVVTLGFGAWLVGSARLGRTGGAVLLGLYLAYIGYLFSHVLTMGSAGT